MAAHDKFDPELFGKDGQVDVCLMKNCALHQAGFEMHVVDILHLISSESLISVTVSSRTSLSCVFEDPFLRIARAEAMIPREGAAMCS